MERMMAKKPTSKDVRIRRDAEICKALGQDFRMAMWTYLSAGPSTVGDICKGAGIPQPLASHHLGLMRGAGLVQVQREGQTKVYSQDPAVTARLRTLFGKVSK